MERHDCVRLEREEPITLLQTKVKQAVGGNTVVGEDVDVDSGVVDVGNLAHDNLDNGGGCVVEDVDVGSKYGL